MWAVIEVIQTERGKIAPGAFQYIQHQGTERCVFGHTEPGRVPQKQFCLSIPFGVIPFGGMTAVLHWKRVTIDLWNPVQTGMPGAMRGQLQQEGD